MFRVGYGQFHTYSVCFLEDIFNLRYISSPGGLRRDVEIGKMGTKTMKDIHENAKRASKFLKSLANENRLVILCALAEGEKNVGELEDILGVRQPTLSQQLARLRADEMVSTRRDSKQIYYSLCNEEAELVLGLIFELFCTGGTQDMEPKSARKSPEKPASEAGVEAA